MAAFHHDFLHCIVRAPSCGVKYTAYGSQECPGDDTSTMDCLLIEARVYPCLRFDSITISGPGRWRSGIGAGRGILCRLDRIESSGRNIYAPQFDVAISWDGRLPFEQRLPPGETCATFTCHGKWTRQLASVLTWSNASILCRGRHRGV